IELHRLLAMDEGQEREFKGSAFVDIKAWAFGGRPAEYSEKLTEAGVLKAIVGMLNAHGGHVIIGVLEKSKFEESSKSSEFFTSLPVSGAFLVCGVEIDYMARQGSGWDEFALKLRAVIRQKV